MTHPIQPDTRIAALLAAHPELEGRLLAAVRVDRKSVV